MTPEASTLLAAALKTATLAGTFDPAVVGARVGLDKFRAQIAARALASAGVLDLGFDCHAAFTPEYRKAHTPAITLAAKPVKPSKPRKRTVRPDSQRV